jgi:hypothetical protein
MTVSLICRYSLSFPVSKSVIMTLQFSSWLIIAVDITYPFFFFFKWAYVTQAGLELMILLSQSFFLVFKVRTPCFLVRCSTTWAITSPSCLNVLSNLYYRYMPLSWLHLPILHINIYIFHQDTLFCSFVKICKLQSSLVIFCNVFFSWILVVN